MSGHLDLARIVVGWGLVLTTLVVAVLVLGARAVRQYGEIGQWGATTATDGLRGWQAWASLCILATWGILLLVAWLPRPRWWPLLIPVVGFVLVALDADAFRERLADEQGGPRTYEALVPQRLPPLMPFETPESPVVYEYEAATRVYDLSVPGGIDAAIVGCWAAIAMLLLLMVLGIVEDLLRGRDGHDGQSPATLRGR